YFQNDDCILESPSFYLGQNAQLSFWAWYNVAIYGVNGFYVQISKDGGGSWHKLDFIGSGGALDSTLMGNDWLPYTYDLSGFEPGTLAKVRFHWVSDDEPLPQGKMSGVFIDDIMVTSQLTIFTESKRIDPLPIPTEYKLSQNYPNPFNSFTKIDYQLMGQSFQEVEMTIFSLLGQKVITLVKERQTGGYYTILWDGKNESGNMVSSGIYVYQLKVSGVKMEKKLIFLQ
ncbi:MAG: T9SS type A sorting domain-containing protein, partial [bacterium]